MRFQEVDEVCCLDAAKNSVEMPEDQRATPAETGPLSRPLGAARLS
jgi:hypothetical protein